MGARLDPPSRRDFHLAALIEPANQIGQCSMTVRGDQLQVRLKIEEAIKPSESVEDR